MKTRPFGVNTLFLTAYGEPTNHEYFRIQDRGKFVKCEVISLPSITKIKMAAHCLKWHRFGRFLGTCSRKL